MKRTGEEYPKGLLRWAVCGYTPVYTSVTAPAHWSQEQRLHVCKCGDHRPAILFVPVGDHIRESKCIFQIESNFLVI